MLEIMTKERMKKGGDVKRRPVEGDQSAEQNSSKAGSDSTADDDVRRGKDLAQLHTDETRCLTCLIRNVFDI